MARNSKDAYAAYILQEELSKDLSEEIKDGLGMSMGRDQNSLIPKTIAIPVSRYSWIKKYSREHMLGQEEENIKKFLVVPNAVVERWGLEEGDLVWFKNKEGLQSIFNVNGFDDPDAVKNRPRLIKDIPSQYAQRRIPIENARLPKPKPGAPDGNAINRLISILAPLPQGGRVIIASPPRAGKSTTLRAIYEALLILTETDPDLFIIALQVGERPEDATELEMIRNRVKHDRSRSELFQASKANPKEENLAGQFRLTKFVKARAERLCEGTRKYGYNVVLLIDSMSRVMMSHSFSDDIDKPKGSGALSQGLHPSSLIETDSLLNVAGFFKGNEEYGERSLTIIPTMLKRDDINVRRRMRSAEHVLFEQSGPSSSTSTIGLVNISNESLKPAIDLDLTFTREYHRLSTPGQLKERAAQVSSMWKRPAYGNLPANSDSEKALAHLIHYAKEHPIFEETQYFEQFDQVHDEHAR